MKLEPEYNRVKALVASFVARVGVDNIASYIEEVRASGEFKDLSTRISWDILRASVDVNTICEWYDKYNVHDSHITTLAKRICKELNII